MSGVWPCWVTQSWLSPVQVPMPSTTANTAGLPWVHCWQSDCMLALLAGSKLTMIGLILRPLMPPRVVDLVDVEVDGRRLLVVLLVLANPNRPASLLTATTGNTTLMVVAGDPACAGAGLADRRTPVVTATGDFGRAGGSRAAGGARRAPARARRPAPTTMAMTMSGGAQLHRQRATAQAPPGPAQRRQRVERPPMRRNFHARFHPHPPSRRSVPPPSPIGPEAMKGLVARTKVGGQGLRVSADDFGRLRRPPRGPVP